MWRGERGVGRDGDGMWEFISFTRLVGRAVKFNK